MLVETVSALNTRKSAPENTFPLSEAALPTAPSRVTRSAAKTNQIKTPKSRTDLAKGDGLDSGLDSVPTFSAVVKDHLARNGSSNSTSKETTTNASASSVGENSANSQLTSGIIGTSNSNVLQSGVLRRPDKWVYVSRLSPSTTAEQMADFFTTSFSTKKEDLHITKIIPKNRDPATITYISFKIGCTSGVFKEVMCGERWPVGIFVKEFTLKNGFTLQPIPNPK